MDTKKRNTGGDDRTVRKYRGAWRDSLGTLSPRMVRRKCHLHATGLGAWPQARGCPPLTPLPATRRYSDNVGRAQLTVRPQGQWARSATSPRRRSGKPFHRAAIRIDCSARQGMCRGNLSWRTTPTKTERSSWPIADQHGALEGDPRLGWVPTRQQARNHGAGTSGRAECRFLMMPLKDLIRGGRRRGMPF
jgi:hypothetical protein